MELLHHWKEIFQAIQEGVLLVNPEGRVVMANEAIFRLSGYAPEELLGASCRILGCDACHQLLLEKGQAWCTLFAGEPSPLKRCAIRRKDGAYLPILKNQVLLKDEAGRVLGAVETLLDLTELDRLEGRVEELTRRLDQEDTLHGLVGDSLAMRRVRDLVEKAAKSDAPALLCGESGTGKELAAQALHDLGQRKNNPFVSVNCAALNESLLESELFGHVKGAFTGAHRHREGRFEAAAGGDIFLDEIGDAPLSIQVKLLRVLETKTFERVGDNRPIRTEARLITATNRNLHQLILEGRFREDLFFRINVIPIHLPTLRERREDIPLLTDVFVRRLAEKTGKPIDGLTAEALQAFMDHPWPGNVRELKSALEYAFVLTESGLIGIERLPPALREQRPARPRTKLPSAAQAAFSVPGSGSNEKTALLDALHQTNGNKSQAARLLGVNRLTVLNRMRKYGIACRQVVDTE